MASQHTPNVEIVRAGYEAFNDGDVEATMERFTEDIEWICPDGIRYGGTYHGPEEVAGFFERINSDIDDLYLDIDRFIDGGETVVAVGTTRGTASETGESLEYPFAHVLDLADGQITRFQEYPDTAQMERALGPER